MTKPDAEAPSKSKDEARKLTMVLINQINKSSDLSAGELETLMCMESQPPGNRWRRYARGFRSMGADERSRVARIAASRGWLKHWVSVCDSEEIGFSSMTDDQIKSYGWVVEGESLKSVRARIAKMIVANKKLESIKSTAKKALINLLDEAQALSFEDRLWVPHEAYAARETECTADGESEYMRVEQFHVDKFFGEVKLMISKIEALESHDKHFIARENPD